MKTKELTKTGIMAAIIYLSIYFLKIVPTPNGYTHLGDCMIFLSVLILGKKNSAFASGIGAALSDALSGYMQWVLPSFFIKGIMAYIMGVIVENIFPNVKYNWLIGATIGGIVQVILYTVTKIFLYDFAYGISRIPILTMQTVCGIVFASILITFFDKSGLIRRLREV